MSLASPKQDPSLHLPRILCLHGGGTNMRIFKAQCRGLARQLQPNFRLVFAQAPFDSHAGPEVMSVYSDWGPFRRWLRWLPAHPEILPEDATRAIDGSIDEAIRRDDLLGATGDWVALLGFSQGAKVCASLLYRQQLRRQSSGSNPGDGPEFKFGILLAGRAPLVALDCWITPAIAGLPDASQISDFKQQQLRGNEAQSTRHILRVPTIHVHGLQDGGLNLHRELLESFCEPGSTSLVEWEGDHRLPLKLHEVSPVVRRIRELAKETGVC